MTHDNFELPTVAALRQQIDRLTRERDHLAALLGNAPTALDWAAATADRDDLHTRLDQMTASRDEARTLLDTLAASNLRITDDRNTHRSQLAELADASRRLIGTLDTLDKAHGFGHPDLDRCIGYVTDALNRITNEHHDAMRMTLTEKAKGILDSREGDEPASVPGVAREDLSESDEARKYNLGGVIVTDSTRNAHNREYVVIPSEDRSRFTKEVNDPSVAGETREPVTTDRYMMATRALHGLGDLSRPEPSLALIYGEDADNWIGEWVTGLGYVNVAFPKATTRELTADERQQFHGRLVEAGNGAYVIRIPDGEAGR
jgi:hypothetical protein